MRGYIMILFLTVNLIVIAQSKRIDGFIYDQKSGEALIGASVHCPMLNLSVMTDRNGHFFFTTSSLNSFKLRISYIGYIPKEFSTDSIKDNMKIYMTPSAISLHEITVSTENKIGANERLSISPLQIKNMHSLTGEADVLRALQTLPGVLMGSEVSSGIHVRGGSLDQNLFILDGVPLYQANHLGGFVSAFEANTIRKIELIKGAFPAMYGGRLSSVVDVRLKDGNQNHHENELMIGTLNSKFFSEGRINQKTTYMVSLRIGNPGWLFALRNLLARDEYENISTGFYFYDFNGKITKRYSDKDKLSLSLYSGNDNLYSKSSYRESKSSKVSINKSSISWGNKMVSLCWNHFYSSNLSSEISLAYTQFLSRNSGKSKSDNTSYQSLYQAKINDLILRSDFTNQINNNIQLSFGNEAILHRFNPGSIDIHQKTEIETIDTSFCNSKISSLETNPYVEAILHPTFALTIRTGFRLSSWISNGRSYVNPEPRISLAYKLANQFTIEGSCTRMTQYVHMLTNSTSNIPNDIWIPSTSRIAPGNSVQTSIGVNWLPTSDFSLSIDAYRKRMRSLTDYSTAEPGMLYSDWESLIATGGTGNIKGLEFQLEKKNGKLNGWCNYTLSKNTRQFSSLNNGDSYPYVYDNRHVVNLVCNYLQTEKTTYTFSWTYKSGNHITLPVGKRYSDNGSQVVYIYTGINNFTTRPYHRLDIGLNYKKNDKTTWHLGIYNAYNSMNPFYYFLSKVRRSDGEVVLKLNYYVLLPFLPSVSYSHRF